MEDACSQISGGAGGTVCIVSTGRNNNSVSGFGKQNKMVCCMISGLFMLSLLCGVQVRCDVNLVGYITKTAKTTPCSITLQDTT